MKEYEDDIPFDGNGVINPRKSTNEEEGAQLRVNESEDLRDGPSDDEDNSLDGSGSNDSLVFPNDLRWWSSKYDKTFLTPSGIFKRFHSIQYTLMLNLDKQLCVRLKYMFSIKYDWLIWFIFHQW